MTLAQEICRVFAHPRCLLTLVALLLPRTALAQNENSLLRGELVKLENEFVLPDGAASNGAALYVPDVKGKQLWTIQTNKADATENAKKAAGGEAGFSGTAFQLGSLYLADNAGERIVRMQPGKSPETFFQFGTGLRPNDLTVDSQGRVYVTLTRQGQVQRISADGSESQVLAEGIVSPNGIALSPAEDTLYVSQYKPGDIIQFDLEQPKLPLTIKPFFEDEALTKADGMCADRSGNVYCAGETAVWIWNPAGELIDKIETPQRPINCCFGGSKNIDLYISTFGGVYRQPMKRYGIQPNPPTIAKLQPKGRPSTALDGVEARVNQVYYREGDRSLLYDWITPQSNEKLEAELPAVLLIHGGGWLHGDKTKFRGLAIRLARKGYAVMAIEYRLGYEAHAPAGVRDSVAAICFLRQNAKALNIDADRIAVVGGSAGGHIAGLLGAASELDEFSPIGKIATLPHGEESATGKRSVNAVVVMAGPLQIVTGSVAERSKEGRTSNATQWTGSSIDTAPDLYRLLDAHQHIRLHPKKGLPNFLFLTGSLDTPTRNNKSLQLLTELGAKGSRKVVHEGARHGHWNQLDWIDRVASDIDQFLTDNLK